MLTRHEPDDHVAVGLTVDRGVDADLGAVVGVLAAPVQDAHSRVLLTHT